MTRSIGHLCLALAVTLPAAAADPAPESYRVRVPGTDFAVTSEMPPLSEFEGESSETGFRYFGRSTGLASRDRAGH
jgi:hypothetical protein